MPTPDDRIIFQITFHPATITLYREDLIEYLEAAGWDPEELADYSLTQLAETTMDNFEPDDYLSDIEAEVPEASNWSILK
jgi:predicted Zn-dependent protease with MMP-like domain